MQSKSGRGKQDILDSLIELEEQYIARLNDLIKAFIKPLRDTRLSVKDGEVLFSNVKVRLNGRKDRVLQIYKKTVLVFMTTGLYL